MRKGNTRSHSELGSQAFLRRWYFVLRHGRVGRCQAIIRFTIMKIASSLKSLKKRDLNSKLVRRRGRVYIINKKILNLKQDKSDNLWIMKVIKIHGTILPNLFYGVL